MKTLIHHAEIGLKGKNFSFFENKLIENIRNSLNKNKIKINSLKRGEKRIILDSSSSEEKIDFVLRDIFGIKNFSFVEESERKIEDIGNHVRKILENFKKQGIKKISFSTKRSDKKFPLTSVEINSRLGETAKNLDLKVDYKNPEKTIFLEITEKTVYIYTEKFQGLGGLPVGTSGKILCLLSGGIDSPVASWLMMKRGCTVNFIHFHAFKSNREALNSKMKKIVEQLNKFQNSSKLYLVPYSSYEVLSQGEIPQKHDLVFFKHFMLKTAEKIAVENNYDAIVLGDNLGQVASQTIENLKASESGISIPVFRPLITYDKQEIIDLSRKINTFDLSVEEYKDCCSIISKNPSTKTKFDTFTKIVGESNLSEIIEKTKSEIEKFNIQ